MSNTQLEKSYDSYNFQAHYTDADEIRLLMQELLNDVEGKRLLEPCAGEGAFLEGLHGKPSLIHALDIDSKHIDQLHDRFGDQVIVSHADFVDIFVSENLFQSSVLHPNYDCVICNPPYGLRFSVDYRKKIKKKFPHLYARESYGLFLYFGITALRRGGRFVYIVPDTFFTSTNHAPLRKFLSNDTTITDIIQFNSKRFETVNFGYGDLCIIAGNYEPPTKDSKTRWADARGSTNNLHLELFEKSEFVPCSYFTDTSLLNWTHPRLRRAITFPDNVVLLGDIAECRTGIYTGDNTRFCAFDAKNPPRRANGHAINWLTNVKGKGISLEEKESGFSEKNTYVPLIRGGHRDPFAETQHAVKWCKESVSFYGSDKKARLQNQKFYFRTGLAIPMVTSGRLSASLMENSIFDQGVVGVFPAEEKYIPFLLIYLNSEIVSTYKKLISPNANNSANYIKRIPVPNIAEGLLSEAKNIVEKAKIEGWESCKMQRDDLVEKSMNH